uniref:Doublecortin domain-containing protein n=1 Tax=Panagrolaimus sp. ES5 TaxID=591445 RepID=A0AC34GWU6_9BILA
MMKNPYISHYTPNVYDPYNNISFLELNKARRGEAHRAVEDRVYNRNYKPLTAKIYIRRNGDHNARLKPFIWRIWQTPKLENLIEEIASHLDMNGSDATLFDARGRIITDSSEIYEGGTFVLGQHEAFDGQTLEAANGNIASARDSQYQQQHQQQQYQDYGNHQRSNYAPLPKKKVTKKKRTTDQYEHHNNYSRPQSSYTYGDLTEIYSVDQEHRDMPEIATSDFGNYDIYRHEYDDDQKNRSNEQEYDDEVPWGDLEDINQKDKHMLSKHRQKFGIRRSRSAVIYNRKDQTNPDAYIIYAFLNGHGLECQYVNFNRKQLEKGLLFILELVARKFNVKPSKLVNMDGFKIRDVTELMSRGAYVLIPVGQNFRDSWYFLPDNAIDTSNDVEKVRARSAQRDRYLQKQESKQIKQTKMRQSVASKRHRSAGPFTGYTNQQTHRTYSVDPRYRGY